MEAPSEVYCASRFVNRPDIEHFECSICLNVPKVPWQCKNGHGHCRTCIEARKQEGGNCPSCGVSLETLVPNIAVAHSFADSMVYCSTNLNGTKANDGGRENVSSSSSSRCSSNGARIASCTWQGKLKDADKHFLECDFANVNCDFEGCDVVVVRSQLAEHRQMCDHRMLTCKWDGCLQQLKPAEMGQHEHECPKRMVMCPNEGCAMHGAFDFLARHRKTCLYELCACPNADDGCTAHVSRGTMALHQLECPKRLTHCANPGCDLITAFDSMAHHRQTCLYESCPCPFAGVGCTAHIRRGEFVQHQLVCPKRLIACTNPGCDMFIAFDSMAQHRSTCPHESCACPFANIGCAARILRRKLDQHQLKCPKRVVMCPNPTCNLLTSFSSLAQHRASCLHESCTCPFADVGCTAQMSRGTMALHQLECPKRLTRCNNPGCRQFATFDSMAQHRASCPHKPIPGLSSSTIH